MRPTLTPEQAASAAAISLDELRRWADEGMPMPNRAGRIDVPMLVHWAAWQNLRAGGVRVDLSPAEAVALAHLVVGPAAPITSKQRDAFGARVAELLSPWYASADAYMAAGCALAMWRLLDHGELPPLRLSRVTAFEASPRKGENPPPRASGASADSQTPAARPPHPGPHDPTR